MGWRLVKIAHSESFGAAAAADDITGLCGGARLN
jgi:hypothetical protein